MINALEEIGASSFTLTTATVFLFSAALIAVIIQINTTILGVRMQLTPIF